MKNNKKYLIPLGLLCSLGLYMAPGQASINAHEKVKNEHSEQKKTPSSHKEAEDKHATTILRVWASIGPGVYLDHAKITVKNARKKMIGTGITTSRGTLKLDIRAEDVNDLPLTVSTSGGQENGKPFYGHLYGEVSDVGKDAKIAHLGILSTVAHRLAKWQRTYPEALTAIREKLEISPYAPEDALRVRNNYIDYQQVQAFVQKLGGFDKLIEKMVVAVESDTKISWPKGFKISVPSKNTALAISPEPTAIPVVSTATTATGTAAPTCTTPVGTNKTSGSTSTHIIADYGVIAVKELLNMAGAPSIGVKAFDVITGMLLTSPKVSNDNIAIDNVQAELDCISSQLSYLTVEMGDLMISEGMVNASACASGGSGTASIDNMWYDYVYLINDAEAYPLDLNNAMLTEDLPKWKDLNYCSNAINVGLFPAPASQTIPTWRKVNQNNVDKGINWYTSADVQKLQAFLSYWGTISYQAYVLNNEYYNWQSSIYGDGKDHSQQIHALSGMAYDSLGYAIFTENGDPVCRQDTLSSTPTFCAYQSNIANAFPGDLYSDEIGLYTTGMAVSAYPGGLAMPIYLNHGDTVQEPQQLGLNPQQILQQYQHTFKWHDNESTYWFSSPGPYQYWYWYASSVTTPSLNQFNVQGINPGNTDSAIETFTNPQAPRTQIPTSTTAGMSDLLNAHTSGGMTAQQFFTSALQSDPTATDQLKNTTSAFLTSDNSEYIYWKDDCLAQNPEGTACKTHRYGMNLVMDSFIGITNNTVLHIGLDSTNSPGMHVLMSRNFWPGAASASTYSPTNPLTAATLVPGKVTIGTATVVSVNSISLSFATPATSALPVTYAAKCDGTGTFTATSAVSPIIVSGLTPNSAYNCSIAAVNAAGTGLVSSYANMTTFINNLTGSAQNKAQATSPSEPRNVRAVTNALSGWITLNYIEPISNGGYPLQGYYAACAYPDGTSAVSPVVSSTIFQINVQATAAQATQAICSVVASNNYYYGTGLYNGYQNQYGPAAALVIGLPLAPNTPRWSTTPGLINVSYSAPSIASASPITGYTASCTATGYPTCTGTVSGSTYTIGVPICDAGVVYQCSVAAQNASGTGTQSMLTTVTTPAAIAPEAPSITSLTVTSSSVTANLTESNNGGSSITGYTLTCANTSSGGIATATGIASPLTVKALIAGATYSCSVTA